MSDLRRLSKLQDGETTIKLFVNLHKTKAFIKCCSGKANPVSAEKLSNFIASQGVIGVDEPKLVEITQGLQSGKFFDEEILIAQGLEPMAGTDGRIELVAQPFPKEQRVKHIEDGSVDYKNLEMISNVVPGQELAIIFEDQEGEFGMDVFGKPIHPPKSNPAKYKLGPNVMLDGEGKIIATQEGLFMLSHETYSVSPVFNVKGNVDYHTGNIDFVGVVKISGDVLNEFAVRAESDVIVGGHIDGAEVESVSDIIVTGGINGNSKASIKAGGMLRTKYVNEAKVVCRGDIHVTDSVTKSQVMCNGSYSGSTSSILSGFISSKKGISIGTIGSATSTGAEVRAGFDYEIEESISNLEYRRNDVDKHVQVLTPDVASWIGKVDELKKLPATKRDRIHEMLKEIQSLQAEKNEINSELEALHARREEIFKEPCEVYVRHKIFPGTKIVMGNAFREIMMDVEGPLCMAVNHELNIIEVRRVSR